MQLDLLNKKLEDDSTQKPGNPIRLSQFEAKNQSSFEEANFDLNLPKSEEVSDNGPSAPEYGEESKQESLLTKVSGALKDTTKSALHSVEVVTETAIKSVQAPHVTLDRV